MLFLEIFLNIKVFNSDYYSSNGIFHVYSLDGIIHAQKTFSYIMHLLELVTPKIGYARANIYIAASSAM